MSINNNLKFWYISRHLNKISINYKIKRVLHIAIKILNKEFINCKCNDYVDYIKICENGTHSYIVETLSKKSKSITKVRNNDYIENAINNNKELRKDASRAILIIMNSIDNYINNNTH